MNNTDKTLLIIVVFILICVGIGIVLADIPVGQLKYSTTIESKETSIIINQKVYRKEICIKDHITVYQLRRYDNFYAEKQDNGYYTLILKKYSGNDIIKNLNKDQVDLISNIFSTRGY